MTALDGIKVLDFTRMHSGPFASMILGDLGAEVLKIEPPEGDETRRMTLFSYGAMSAFYAASNRNKRSLVLDLRDPRTRPDLERLVAGADIVIDNFRPSTLHRFELDYASIAKINPRVIAVTVTGYGEGSPEADSPAYDLLAQARAGIMSLTGDADGPPTKAGAPIGDIVAGVYAVAGALAALHERDRTGKGQRVEVAMLDAQIAMVHYHYSYFDASGEVLPRVGSEHQNMVPYGIFRCRDGYIAIAAVPEPPKFFVELCDCLGHPEWVHDPRFDSADARRRNRTELKQAMESVLSTDTKVAWFERLRIRGVPVAPVNDVSDLRADAQVRAREMLVALKSADDRAISLPGNPIKMRGALPTDLWAAPPELGDWRTPSWPSERVDDVDGAEPFDRSLLVLLPQGVWALRAWVCRDCHRAALGAATKCATCGSRNGDQTVLRNEGTLETWSRISGKTGPYIVGYALLPVDGDDMALVRVFGPVQADREDALQLGMPVGVVFEASDVHGKRRTRHCFVPAPSTRTPSGAEEEVARDGHR
jgi:CoA:oxalate CoA-transferase